MQAMGNYNSYAIKHNSKNNNINSSTYSSIISTKMEIILQKIQNVKMNEKVIKKKHSIEEK
jgi:hypothetical protein